VRPYLRVLTPLLVIVMAVVLAGCGEQYIVLDPKGPIGSTQRDLIVITTVLCSIIIVPVLIMTAVIGWRYRDRKGSKAKYKPNWDHNSKLEFTWWSIPIVIIIILAAITAKYTFELEPSKAMASTEEPVVIEVTSLDWKWLFTYPEEGIATVNYIKIPEDRPIRFQLTSDITMNSFWIPQLGGQLYTMSGMAMTLYLQADEPGTYFGTGANFTGKDFAQMTFDVDAVSDEEYAAWIDEVKATDNELTDEGFEKLRQRGTSDVQLFSAFPEGLFQKVMTQFAVGGMSHHHHGVIDAPADSNDQGSHAGH